jgi:hypothetical protein
VAFLSGVRDCALRNGGRLVRGGGSRGWRLLLLGLLPRRGPLWPRRRRSEVSREVVRLRRDRRLHGRFKFGAGGRGRAVGHGAVRHIIIRARGYTWRRGGWAADVWSVVREHVGGVDELDGTRDLIAEGASSGTPGRVATSRCPFLRQVYALLDPPGREGPRD